MKIHLCSAYREHNALDIFLRAAALDQNNEHQSCDNPEEADVILFVEDAHFDDYLYKKLITHPYLRHWRHKCYMYNEVDSPWSVLPGLYCSMPQWSFEPGRQRAFPYAATPNARIQSLFSTCANTERSLLFSFVGTGCNNLRKRMIKTGLDQGGTIIDTSGFNVWDCDEEEKQRQGKVFATTMAQSKFVLCPRGLGTSSFRLFETMQAGRAPVIIADSWVAPNQSDWSFAIRIQENALDTLSDRLLAQADEAIERGGYTEGDAAMEVFFKWNDASDPNAWMRLSTFNTINRPNPS
ncbi:MAG: exostosin domain-containing protein, partial [Granulosicoccaceae bacterium]